MIYTGQRRSDIVRMGWQHISGDTLAVVQDKTRGFLRIPFHPKLAASIGKLPRLNMTFLLTEAGAPFSAAGFGNWFRERCNEAGLQHCSAHDCAKLAQRDLQMPGARLSKSSPSPVIKRLAKLRVTRKLLVKNETPNKHSLIY